MTTSQFFVKTVSLCMSRISVTFREFKRNHNVRKRVHKCCISTKGYISYIYHIYIYMYIFRYIYLSIYLSIFKALKVYHLKTTFSGDTTTVHTGTVKSHGWCEYCYGQSCSRLTGNRFDFQDKTSLVSDYIVLTVKGQHITLTQGLNRF